LDCPADWAGRYLHHRRYSLGLALPENNASVLGPTGKPFTADSIGLALGMRDLHRHLREATGGQTYNAGFGPKDRSRFLGALENMIQAVRRAHASSGVTKE
jgi:uncharacterized protein YaiI (UPF0178 family)